MLQNWTLPISPAAVPRLVLGIVSFGAGIGAMARADLGLGPWSVLHQGIGERIGIPMGTVDVLLSVPIVFAFLPLRQRAGLGTLLSATLLGMTTNFTLLVLPQPDGSPMQFAFMAAGVAAIGFGSAMYLTSNMGPGPRDGIMTGLHQRYGWRIRTVRTALEVSVLIIGFALGGTVGIGTVLYAIVIGQVIELALRMLGYRGRVPVPTRI